MARSVPWLADAFSSKLYLAASVRSWKPSMPWSTPWLARVQTYGTSPNDVQPIGEAVVGGQTLVFVVTVPMFPFTRLSAPSQYSSQLSWE